MVQEVKPGAGVCFGFVAGFGLLLFAAALVATSQVPGLGDEVTSAVLGDRRLQATMLPLRGLTKMSAASLVGASQIDVESADGLLSDMYIIIDPTHNNPETAQIKLIEVTTTTVKLTLGMHLVRAHEKGTVVFAKPESLSQESSQRSSFSSSSASLSASSFGGPKGSGANKEHEEVGFWGGTSAGSIGTLNFLLALCFACAYKSKAVDPIGQMRKQYETTPDFTYSIFDCFKDIHLCCMIIHCPWIRIAHTNEAADVCGFWETFLCMWCATLCVCGPLCLNVYFRIHVKDALGIDDNMCQDICLGLFCLPCSTGQQALAVDEAMGYKFLCPFTMNRIAGSTGSGYGGYGPGGGGGQEMEPLW